MSLLDLFRKAHKNSDPAIRIDAVRQLPDEELQVLTEVVREDPDTLVRRAAIKRLKDADVLASVARSDADEANRRIAAERVARHFAGIALQERDEAAGLQALGMLSEPRELAKIAKGAASAGVARAALERLPDGRELADVARHAAAGDLRLAAIARVSSAGILAQAAVHDADEAVALTALARVEDAEALRRIARDATRKAVRRQASEMLQSRGLSAEGPSKQRRAEQLAAVNEVESLVGSIGSDVAEARIRQASVLWETLGTDAVAEVAARFDRAVKAFVAAREELLAARASAGPDAVRDAADDHTAERLQLCERVEALEGDAITAGLEEALVSWSALPPAPTELLRRFERACREALHRRDAHATRGERRQRLEALLVEAARALDAPEVREARRGHASCERIWREQTAVGPADPDLQERWDEMRGRMEGRDREARDLERAEGERRAAAVEALLARMNEAAGKPDGKDVTPLLKEARDIVKRSGSLPSARRKELREQLDAAVKRLEDHLRDLREGRQWHQSIAEPVLEELCRRVEALREEPDARKANAELRALREAWNQRASLATGKLRDFAHRFNKAAAEVRARCDALFAEQDVARKANLEKRLALCAAAEELSGSSDWRETTVKLQTMQAEWKQIGEVPRKDAEAVWQRFRKACDTFFQRKKENFTVRSEERTKNLERKMELVQRAEALADSTDWEAAGEELKRAQVAWKSIGPSADADETWHRFRKACDRFFDRRSRRHDVEREAREGRVEERVRAVEALAEATPAADEVPADLAPTVMAAWNEVRGAEGMRRARDLESRLRKATESLLALHPGGFSGTELDPATTRRRREDLCKKAEALHRVPAPPAKPATLEEMVAQLRVALKQGPPKEDPHKAAQRAAQELDRLQDLWQRLPPLPGDDGAALEARFRKAVEALRPRREPASTV